MPIVILYSFLTHVLMRRNVMINPNAKCCSLIQNLMMGKLGQDCSHSQKNMCIWYRGEKMSGSVVGLGWGKTSTFKCLHLTVAEFLWGLFKPASGSMSTNSMSACTNFVMSWGFSGKQVAQESIHAWGVWITKSWKMLEYLLMYPYLVHLKRPWSWGNVKSNKDSRKKTSQLVKINQSCELERAKTWI